MVPTLPEGWETNYDGDHEVYRHAATGSVQYHFPRPGDDHDVYRHVATASVQYHFPRPGDENLGSHPTRLPSKGSSGSTPAAEESNTPHVCPDCLKEFSRLCDLNKHAKSHSRPYKCAVQSCKYHDHGWPTAKELERHVNDKHSFTPRTFACAFPPCTYESKREANCRQHMEKKHGWTYVRSKSNGKRLGLQQIMEYPGQSSAAPSEGLYAAPDASGSKPTLEPSPSLHQWLPNSSKGGETNSPAAPPSDVDPQLVMEELDGFADMKTELLGVIRPDDDLSSSDDSVVDFNEAEHQEFLRRSREAKRRQRLAILQKGNQPISEVLGYHADVEYVDASGSSPHRLHREDPVRDNLAFDLPPPQISGLDLAVPSTRFDASMAQLTRGLPYSQYHTMEVDSEPEAHDQAFNRGRHRLETRSKSQGGGSQSRWPLGTRAEILATTMADVDVKEVDDKQKPESNRERFVSPRRPTAAKGAVQKSARFHPRAGNRTTSTLARHFEQLTREFEKERMRDRKRRVDMMRTTAFQSSTSTQAIIKVDAAANQAMQEPGPLDDNHADTAVEIAREKGQTEPLDWGLTLPRETPSRSTGETATAGTEADGNHYDSDTSDLESIMSETPSIASSRSSAPANIDLGAIQELRTLLLTNEALVPLYDVAISKVGPEKFYRNFRRLLLRYGRALGTEATSFVQLKAARFVRFAASRVSMQIKENISNKDAEEQGKGKQNAKELGDYLKQMQDVDDSSTEDSDHDPEEASLQTLESVKSFMLSSAAFSDLCRSFRVWLGGESQSEQPNAPTPTTSQVEVKETSSVEISTASTHCQPISPQNENPKFASHCKNPAQPPLTMLAKSQAASAKDRRFIWESVSSWASVIRTTRQLVTNRLSGLLQASPPRGHVGVSWICRCGDLLRIQVPEGQQRAAIAFAKQAAGPNSHTVVSRPAAGTSPAPSSTRATGATGTADQSTSRPSLTPSSSNFSANTDTTTDSYSTSATTRSASSRPESPNTVPSDEELSQPEPFLPAGTKKYMLLCVNTSGPRGIPQRKLANVDVTDVECGAEMFQRLRNAYFALRPRRNPFFVPKTMHYVKFQLFFLQKSGECIGAYEVDSIPSNKEIIKQEYAFSPCPPRIGKLPLPPDIFMHGFLDPCDHLGPMAVEMLPKKLWSQLRWDARANDRYNVPAGWGFYIVEGINWALVSWFTAVALLAVTALTMSWSILMGDVQGGTGLGQYCLAVLTVSVSAWLLKYSVEPLGYVK